MKTFNKATQKKYIERAIGHLKADNIIQGYYFKNGKGCCVGCLANANENAHEALEKQTGVPVWLSKVADTIHEGFPDGEYQIWPEKFIAAIPNNKTPEFMELKVKSPFLIYVLESTLKNFDHEKYPDVKRAVEGSIALWKRSDIGSTEWADAARAAARAAASDASDAARAAARAAAWAASAAASAAASDARAAASDAASDAAWAAARAASAAASDASAAAASDAAWAARAASDAAWAAASDASAAASDASAAASDAAWAANAAASAAAYKDYSDKLIEIMESL